MLRKLLIVLMMAALAISLVPLEAFCDDHHESEPTAEHQCGLACHFNSLMPAKISVEGISVVLAYQILQQTAYQNPSLSPLKRPPILSA